MEAAFILPVLLLIVFGIIEFGQVFQKSLTMSDATRSGARLGAAQPRQDGYHDDIAIAVRETLRAGMNGQQVEYLSIFKADPVTGEPVDGDSPEECSTCYRYTWDQTTQDWDPITGPSWAAVTQSACGDVGDTDYLGVYVRGRHDMSTSFLPGTITVKEQTVMRLEPLPLADECKPG